MKTVYKTTRYTTVSAEHNPAPRKRGRPCKSPPLAPEMPKRTPVIEIISESGGWALIDGCVPLPLAKALASLAENCRT